jgi:hypothetical protein
MYLGIKKSQSQARKWLLKSFLGIKKRTRAITCPNIFDEAGEFKYVPLLEVDPSNSLL